MSVIDWKSVAKGSVVAIVLATLWAMLAGGIVWAFTGGESSGALDGTLRQVIAATIGLLAMGLGGFAAMRRAGRRPFLHGALVAGVVLALAFTFEAAMRAAGLMREETSSEAWLSLLGNLLAFPAAMLGAWMGRREVERAAAEESRCVARPDDVAD